MRKVTKVHYEPPIRILNGWDMRIAGEETKIEQEDCNMANNNLMSREKQIEEMAKATMKYCKTDNRCGSCHWSTCNECMSEFLYNAGYRKQIVGEWKQTEEPMGWHDVDCVECSACGESWVLDDNLEFDLIVEYWHYCPNCGAKMKGGAE